MATGAELTVLELLSTLEHDARRVEEAAAALTDYASELLDELHRALIGERTERQHAND